MSWLNPPNDEPVFSSRTILYAEQARDLCIVTSEHKVWVRRRSSGGHLNVRIEVMRRWDDGPVF